MIIQQIIAPATMIPACGLLLLSSTARMNTLLARIRSFHHERLDVWASSVETGSRAEFVRALRIEGLEHQTHRLLRRAGLLRLTMLQLLVAVTCNLLTVIGLALRFMLDDGGGMIHVASLVVFIFGVLVMIGSMATSIAEVTGIMESPKYEHRRLERLCESDAAGVEGLAMDADSGEGTGL